MVGDEDDEQAEPMTKSESILLKRSIAMGKDFE